MENAFPEPWRTLAERVGISSYGQLAQKSGLSRPTVYSAVSGRSAKPQLKTLEGLAKAFRITLDELLEILGEPVDEPVSPYVPPEESALLTRRERDHVDELIRILVSNRAQAPDATASPDTYIADAQAKLEAFQQGNYQLAARHQPNHDPTTT